MGYRHNEDGRLCCDRCGTAGARKRKCPYRVYGHSLRNTGRVWLPWCQPLALCGECFEAMGGQDGVHGQRCRTAAAKAQADAHAIERRIHAGESLSVAAWGDWEPGVPKDMVGVKFVGRDGVTTYRLMREADYPNTMISLRAVASRRWPDHPVVPGR